MTKYTINDNVELHHEGQTLILWGVTKAQYIFVPESAMSKSNFIEIGQAEYKYFNTSVIDKLPTEVEDDDDGFIITHIISPLPIY